MVLTGAYTDLGTEATYTDAYIRIEPESIRIDFRRRHLEFDVLVYFNQRARTLGRAQVAKRTVRVTGDDFTTLFGDPIVALGYTFLRTLPEFQNARDA